MSPWTAILIAWGSMAVVMVGLWAWQVRTHNAGIVDVAWSFGTALCAIWFAAEASGDEARRWLIGIIVGLWGLRLGTYLFIRMRGAHEDRRYAALREKWGERTQRNMFIIFQVQAFWAVLFALPMLLAASNPVEGLRWFDWLGLGIWVVSTVGVSVADWQLHRFRKASGNEGEVCTRGLWRYSRHPNYFFEWVHWWAYVAIGLAGPWGWLTFAGPAVMLFFLLRVTGVPITEKALVASRGEAYRRYQRTTSVFVPLPPRKGS